MLRLYVVRHGVTVWNDEGRLQGHTDVPLSLDGRHQARRLAERLAGEPLAAVWSSDLVRASATAEAIAAPHGLRVRTTPLLRETMLGEWEGLTEPEVAARGEAEAWRAWRRDPAAHRPPGSEPLEHVWLRVLQARDALRAEHSSGVATIVGHGGSLRAILCEALGAPVTSMVRLSLANASLTLIEYGPGRTTVRFVNCTLHSAT